MADEQKTEIVKKTSSQFTLPDENVKPKVLTFDEINVGMDVPQLIRWITYKLCKSSIDIAMHGEDIITGHSDPKSSQVQFGVASMPVSGEVTSSGVAMMMVNWCKDPKPWLVGGKLEDRFTRLVSPGDTLYYGGKVTEKKVDGDKKYVFCEVWADNQRGERCLSGTTRLCFSDK
jgi:acyl dehydratase